MIEPMCESQEWIEVMYSTNYITADTVGLDKDDKGSGNEADWEVELWSKEGKSSIANLESMTLGTMDMILPTEVLVSDEQEI